MAHWNRALSADNTKQNKANCTHVRSTIPELTWKPTSQPDMACVNSERGHGLNHLHHWVVRVLGSWLSAVTAEPLPHTMVISNVEWTTNWSPLPALNNSSWPFNTHADPWRTLWMNFVTFKVIKGWHFGSSLDLLGGSFISLFPSFSRLVSSFSCFWVIGLVHKLGAFSETLTGNMLPTQNTDVSRVCSARFRRTVGELSIASEAQIQKVLGQWE